MRKWVGGIVARFERRRICAGSRSQNFLPRLARMRACVNVSPLWPAFSSTRTEITRAKNKFTPLVTPRRLGIMFGHCGRPARYHSLTICHLSFRRQISEILLYLYMGIKSFEFYLFDHRQSRKKTYYFFLFNRTLESKDRLSQSISVWDF